MARRLILTAALGGLVLLGAGGASKGGPQYLDVATGPLFSKPELVAKLPAGVRFTFGDQPVEVVRKLGVTRSSRATVRGPRTLNEACRWALLSALKSMGEQTTAAGGNAVVGLRSTLDDQRGTDTTFRCRTSNSIVHVAVEGEMAQVK